MGEGSHWCCRGVTREVVLIMKTSGLLICSAVETCQIGSCLLSEVSPPCLSEVERKRKLGFPLEDTDQLS